MLGLPECLSVSPETGERRQLLESLGNLSSATRTFQQPQPSSCNLLSPQHTILFLPPRWVFAHGNAHLAWSPWEVTQRWNLGLLHCRQVLYHLNHQGSPRILEWVPIPSPLDLPDPGIDLGSPTLQANSLPAELPGSPI